MASGLSIVDRKQWAEDQFGEADLGDKRRTRRLVRTMELMAGNSAGSLPQQMGNRRTARATYRLYSMEEVTHEAVCTPHFQHTRKAASRGGTVFLVQDTMELNYTSHDACEGLAPIGHGGQMKGLHQQNVLAVDGETRLPLGLMWQKHHRRVERDKPVGDRRAAQRKIPAEERESHWWIESIEAIGSPPPGTTWVHVGDRGEDVFGVYVAAKKANVDWLIRAAQDRRVETPEGSGHLFELARSLPAVATRTVRVRRRKVKEQLASPEDPAGAETGTVEQPKSRRGHKIRKGGKGRAAQKARTNHTFNKDGGDTEEVKVSVASSRVRLLPTRSDPVYRDEQPIDCYVVRTWEPNPRAGVEPLEWIIITSLPCEDAKGAVRVAEAYSMRWLIEEFHKCEKTGCAVESRRLESVSRLEPLIGALSVLAVCLLQLKLVAREDPDAKATELFDERMVRVMGSYLGTTGESMTVSEFWRGIGLLGGHMGTKHDGPLGWLRAWRGWQAFQLILLGATLIEKSHRTQGAFEMR